MVGLVEMLLDVLVLIGDFGPHFHIFPDAQDAALCDAQVFAEAVVNGARYTDIERTSAFLADTNGLVDGASKP